MKTRKIFNTIEKSKIEIASKMCERNNIVPTSFYQRVKLIYQKCLAFLERYEGKLPEVDFDDLYLASNSFIYMLSNIRRKGKGEANSQDRKKQMLTKR